MTNNVVESSDGFEYLTATSKSRSNSKRFYVGNLPMQWKVDELKNLFIHRLGKDHQKVDLIQCEERHAILLVTDIAPEQVLSQLKGLKLHGHKVVVQRERRNHKSTGTSVVSTFASSSSWSKPTTDTAVSALKTEIKSGTWTTTTSSNPSHDTTANVKHDIYQWKDAAESIAPLVDQYMHDQNSSHGDLVTSALVSTAAVVMTLSAFESEINNESETENELQQINGIQSKTNIDNEVDETTEVSTFTTLLQQKPFASLLAEFGEQDTDWQNMKVNTTQLDVSQSDVSSAPPIHMEIPILDGINRLERHGKAPIHIEFVSFGYRHGTPPDLCNLGYTQPMSALDCRTSLMPVPQYLTWMDGMSGAVRNVYLRPKRSSVQEKDKYKDTKNNKNDNNDSAPINYMNVREFVQESVILPVTQAIHDAIQEGGHGYAMPLRMTVYVGSEEGRHRSVLVAELAATALRKVLRCNSGNQITVPVSVGTRHRDIEQSQHRSNGRGGGKGIKGKKQKDFEDD